MPSAFVRNVLAATLLGLALVAALNATVDPFQQYRIPTGYAARFYPVFQFVLWGGKSPSEAISAALIETVGEA